MERSLTSILLVLFLFSCSSTSDEIGCGSGFLLLSAIVESGSASSPHDSAQIDFELCISNESKKDTLLFYLDSFEESPRGSFFIVFEKDTCELVNYYIKSKQEVLPASHKKFSLNTRYCILGSNTSSDRMKKIAKTSKLIYIDNSGVLNIERANTFKVKEN